MRVRVYSYIVCAFSGARALRGGLGRARRERVLRASACGWRAPVLLRTAPGARLARTRASAPRLDRLPAHLHVLEPRRLLYELLPALFFVRSFQRESANFLLWILYIDASKLTCTPVHVLVSCTSNLLYSVHYTCTFINYHILQYTRILEVYTYLCLLWL